MGGRRKGGGCTEIVRMLVAVLQVMAGPELVLRREPEVSADAGGGAASAE
jgi:hypothetical protein